MLKSPTKNTVSEITISASPISVLPLFSKALEKILHSCLIGFFDKHDILSGLQNGFRKKKKEKLPATAERAHN